MLMDVDGEFWELTWSMLALICNAAKIDVFFLD